LNSILRPSFSKAGRGHLEVQTPADPHLLLQVEHIPSPDGSPRAELKVQSTRGVQRLLVPKACSSRLGLRFRLDEHSHRNSDHNVLRDAKGHTVVLSEATRAASTEGNEGVTSKARVSSEHGGIDDGLSVSRGAGCWLRLEVRK